MPVIIIFKVKEKTSLYYSQKTWEYILKKEIKPPNIL